MRTVDQTKQDRKSTQRRNSRKSMENFEFNDELERQMGRRTGKYFAKKQGREHFDGFNRFSDLQSVSSTLGASEVTSELAQSSSERIMNVSNKSSDSFVLDEDAINQHDASAIQNLSSIQKRHSTSPPRVSGSSLLLMLQSNIRASGDFDMSRCQEQSKTEGFIFIEKSITEDDKVSCDKMKIKMDGQTNKQGVKIKQESKGEKSRKSMNNLKPIKKQSDAPIVQDESNKVSQNIVLKPRRIQPQLIRKSNVMRMPNIIERDEIDSQCSKIQDKKDIAFMVKGQTSLIESNPHPRNDFNYDERPILGYPGPISAPPQMIKKQQQSHKQNINVNLQGVQNEIYDNMDDYDDREPNKKRSREYRKSVSDSDKSMDMKQPRKQRKVQPVKLEKRKQTNQKKKNKKRQKSRPSKQSPNSGIQTRRQKMSEGVLPEQLKQQAEQYHSVVKVVKVVLVQSSQQSSKNKFSDNKNNKRWQRGNMSHKMSSIKQQQSRETRFHENNLRSVRENKYKKRTTKSKNNKKNVSIKGSSVKSVKASSMKSHPSGRVIIPLQQIIDSEPSNSKRSRLRPLKFWQSQKLQMKKDQIIGMSTNHPQLNSMVAKFVSKKKQNPLYDRQSQEQAQQKQSRKHVDILSIETILGVRSNHKLIEQMTPHTYRLELEPNGVFRIEKGFFKRLNIQVVSAKQGKLVISFTTVSHKLVKSFVISAYEDFKITNNSATKPAIIDFLLGNEGKYMSE